MRSKIEWIRLFVAVFTVCGLLVAGMPDTASAQADPSTQHQHKWKHDKIKPPGPPCPPDQRPCPWGPGTGGTNPGGNQPGGGNPDLAINVLFVQGMEPSPAFVDAVTSLSESTLSTPTPVPAPAQRAVFDALGGTDDPENTALARGLTKGNGGALEASAALITAMRGLTTTDGQLPSTVDAFNGFVDASSDEFLTNPSPEFLVVHSFIGTLVEEAMGTSEGSH